MTLAPQFLVVGAGRSGTTLVRTLLMTHPDVYVTPETGFVPRLLRHSDLITRSSTGIRPRGLVAAASANGRLALAGVKPGDLLRSIDRNMTIPEALDRAYRAMATRDGAGDRSLIGDKTPGYALELPILDRWFPNALVINVVRDPRAVITSLASVPWGPNSVEDGAHYWRSYIEAALRFEAMHPDRIITVRYEDLISDVDGRVDRLLAFIGADPTVERLDRNDSAQNRHPGTHANLTRDISDRSDWRHSLSESDQRTVLAHCEPLMKTLGYDTSGASDIEVAMAIDFTDTQTIPLRRVRRRAATVGRGLSALATRRREFSSSPKGEVHYVGGYGRSGSSLLGRSLAADAILLGEIASLTGRTDVGCSCGQRRTTCPHWRAAVGSAFRSDVVAATLSNDLRRAQSWRGLLLTKKRIRRLVTRSDGVTAEGSNDVEAATSYEAFWASIVGAGPAVDISKTSRLTAARPLLLQASGFSVELHRSRRPLREVAASRARASRRQGLRRPGGVARDNLTAVAGTCAANLALRIIALRSGIPVVVHDFSEVVTAASDSDVSDQSHVLGGNRRFLAPVDTGSRSV